METSEQSEPSSVLALGRRLVEELGLEESNDTLSRWMAHHLADLITKAENAAGSDKDALRKECFDAILALWRHRSELPGGKRPFEELEPVLRAVESLDPEDGTPRYYRTPRPPKGEEAETAEQEEWLKMVEGLDYSAKVLIGYCLAEAAASALDDSKEWVKLAEGIEDDGVPEIVIRLVKNAADLNKVPDLNASLRKTVVDRINRLQGFVRMAESLALTLSERLAAIPATESGEDSEEIILSAPPSLSDTSGRK
jgi:hypothetical protein